MAEQKLRRQREEEEKLAERARRQAAFEQSKTNLQAFQAKARVWLTKTEDHLEFQLYKKVLQLFFNLYNSACLCQVIDCKKLLNWLQNQCRQQYNSMKNKNQFVKEVEVIDIDVSEKRVAGNVLLTLIRSGALRTNIKAEFGRKVI